MPTLLIVEDDLEVADMLEKYFRAQGYRVRAIDSGEEAVNHALATVPDLIILDIRLPDIDGYQVAQNLRSNQRTQNIPIIFLTERRERASRLRGLENGADDYITKPFDVQELRLRVRNALHRREQGSLTNPVTSLPEGALVDERLQECLEGDDWAVLLVSLNHLDNFREAYGFVAADDVLRAISVMMQNAIREVGNPADFIGQLGRVDFILVSTGKYIDILTNRIHERLIQSLDYFYPLEDREEESLSRQKLAVELKQYSPSQGPFNNVEHLKATLLKGRYR
ncbi:MAG: response regulator [Anaerolineales bacterium]|jgi:PleD family two-component response regulator